MPFISLRDDLFGITSLLDFRKETAAPLCHLTEVLLRGPSTLTEAERELIASHVSALNACAYCSTAHTAATCLLPGGEKMGLTPMETDIHSLNVSDKVKALLHLASLVQQSGLRVTQSDIDEAKSKGATDLEIHDTILIAALFCLYNRYVDGLGATTPTSPSYYSALGRRITSRGYEMPDDGYHALTT